MEGSERIIDRSVLMPNTHIYGAQTSDNSLEKNSVLALLRGLQKIENDIKTKLQSRPSSTSDSLVLGDLSLYDACIAVVTNDVNFGVNQALVWALCVFLAQVFIGVLCLSLKCLHFLLHLHLR